MLTINIIDQKNFIRENELNFVQEAIDLLYQSINSSFFENSVRQFGFDGKRSFHYTNYTNDQVYALIMTGREIVEPIFDREMDLRISLIRKEWNGKSIGMSNPNNGWIFTWAGWLNTHSPSDYAGHLAHEWCHLAGFKHPSNLSSLSKYTVPYAIGYLISRISSSLEIGVVNDID